MEFIFLRLVILQMNLDTWVSLFVASIEKLAPLSFFFFYLLSSDDAYIIKWRSEKQLGYHVFLPLDISSTVSFIHFLLAGETDLWCCHLLLPTLHWWCFFPEFSKLFMPQLVKQCIDSPGASHFMQRPFSEIYSKDLALALWKITLFWITYLCLLPKWQNTNA